MTNAVFQLPLASSSVGATDTLTAALALRDAGFAVQWLHEKQKRPIGKNWSERPVATADQLRATYQTGYNVGARLGEPSATPFGYLHALDLDIRVAEVADEAWAALADLLPGIRREDLPEVQSGSGGESRHLYFFSERPFRSKRLWTSGSKFRDSAGKWHFEAEIELFGTGKQTVLPPSIHPSGQPYRWLREFDFDAFEQPYISAFVIESLGVVDAQTFGYESRPPLTFDRPGQMERELDAIPVSDLHYDDWIRLGQAIHHQFGGSQEGYDLWLHHTKRSTKFEGETQVREMRKSKWKSFGKYRGEPVTMATVRQWYLNGQEAALRDGLDDLGGQPEPVGNDFDDLLNAPALTVPAAATDDEAVFSLGLSDKVDWKSLLDFDKERSTIRPTLHNFHLILANDIRTAGLMAFNEFSQDVVQRSVPGRRAPSCKNQAKPIIQLSGAIWRLKDRQNGDYWSEGKDHSIRAMLEAPMTQGGYGIKVPDRDLRAAIDIVARENCFHPVREYLAGLEWDGVERAERLFIDYLGAPDDAYTRSVGRLMLTAAVARVFEPGCKFDTAVILQGLQGKRKSTFISTLAKSWFAELEGDISDTKVMVEAMQKAWILEMPELGGFVRGDVRHVKAFISRRTDKVRLAYARRAGEFDRQCIFIGSTNDDKYLKDDTGNRRFWPIACAVDSIDTDRLAAEVDQIWAEALTLYQAMRARQPTGTLPLYLTDAAAQQIAVEMQEAARVENADEALAGQIAAWLETPITSGSVDDDLNAAGQPVMRNEVCGIQVWVECLCKDRASYTSYWPAVMGRAMRLVPGWHERKGKRPRLKTWGQQRVYWRDGYTGAASELL